MVQALKTLTRMHITNKLNPILAEIILAALFTTLLLPLPWHHCTWQCHFPRRVCSIKFQRMNGIATLMEFRPQRFAPTSAHVAQRGSAPWVRPSQEPTGAVGEPGAPTHRPPSRRHWPQPSGGHFPGTPAPKCNAANTYSNLIEASEEVLSKSHRKKKSRLKEK